MRTISVLILLFISGICQVFSQESESPKKLRHDDIGDMIFQIVANPSALKVNVVIHELLNSKTVVELQDGTRIPFPAIALCAIEERYGFGILDKEHKQTIAIVGVTNKKSRFRYTISMPNEGEVDRIKIHFNKSYEEIGLIIK